MQPVYWWVGSSLAGCLAWNVQHYVICRHFGGARSLYQDRYFQESTQQLIFPGPGKSLWSRILDSVLPVQRPRPDPWLENPKPTTQKSMAKEKRKNKNQKTTNWQNPKQMYRNRIKQKQKKKQTEKRKKKEQKSLKMKTIRNKLRERAKESKHKHIKWSKKNKSKKKKKQTIKYICIYILK